MCTREFLKAMTMIFFCDWKSQMTIKYLHACVSFYHCILVFFVSWYIHEQLVLFLKTLHWKTDVHSKQGVTLHYECLFMVDFVLKLCCISGQQCASRCHTRHWRWFSVVFLLKWNASSRRCQHFLLSQRCLTAWTIYLSVLSLIQTQWWAQGQLTEHSCTAKQRVWKPLPNGLISTTS